MALQIATEEWSGAVESLYLSICRHNTCILTLSSEVTQGSQLLMEHYFKLLAGAPQGQSGTSTPSPAAGWAPGRTSCSLRLGRLGQVPVAEAVLRVTEVVSSGTSRWRQTLAIYVRQQAQVSTECQLSYMLQCWRMLHGSEELSAAYCCKSVLGNAFTTLCFRANSRQLQVLYFQLHVALP